MRRSAKALAVLAGSALALTACAASSSGGGSGETASSTGPANTTFTWGYGQEFASYNPNTPSGNSSANAVIVNQVIRGFWVFAPDGKIKPDTDFGTYEKTSDNPLTVKYTFNPKATWSDGNPIDCDDAMLAWLANSGVTQVNGKGGFETAAATGYSDQEKPQCKDGDKTFTIVYKKPFADWEGMYGAGVFMPAHIVEKQGNVPDIIAAADKPTDPSLAAAEKFYNTAWTLNPGQLKPDIMPSAGAYAFKAWQAQQSMTLEANPKWWGTPPKTKTIVVRYIADDSQTQALQSGEINAMDPQPQTETVNQLKAAGNKVKFSTHDQYTFEHFDLNFATVFKDPNVRLAFAKCLPRQQIVDNLIKSMNPNAQILQSRFAFPFEARYATFKGQVGDNYQQVDIAGAKALLAKSGLPQPVKIRIGWRKDPENINKRRADQIALTQASCNQAGFQVIDSGTPDFFDKALPKKDFDVAMFAWAGSPLVTANSAIYVTKGDSNFDNYSNPQIDQLFATLNQTTNVDQQNQLLKQADQILWKDLVTFPVFAFPAVLGTTPDAEGVVYNATQADLSWNSYEWALKQ